MDTIKDFKRQFEGRKGIHFNSAGQSPVSRLAAERAREVVQMQEESGSLADPVLIAGADRARQRLADFLGARKEDAGFAPNVASALSQAALGFPLRSGDEVVTIDQEYASSYYPWAVACERSGAVLRVFSSGPDGRVDLDAFLGFIRPGTRVVAVSWVQFQTGAILDLERVGAHCRSIGAAFVVDGIQGLGQLPFSLHELPVDFIAGAAHKWMGSLVGQGFFAGTPEFLSKLSPVTIGAGTFGRWGTFGNPGQKMDATSRRFEPGGLAFAPLFALDSAIGLLQATGAAAIETEIRRLSARLRSGLQELGVHLATPVGQRGGATSVRLESRVEARFLERCRDEKIALSKRGEFVRFSLHAYCLDPEIDRVLGILKESL